MRIINAHWEKRNLGVDCLEITIDKEDTLDTLKSQEIEFNNIDYIVIKVPIGRFDINSYLSSLGFSFIEGILNFRINVKDAFLNKLQHRLNNAITYTEMNDSDQIELIQEIENGLFKSDRIILDYYFEEGLSAKRYSNWIKDELTRTTQVYKILHKEDTIGFFTFKESGPETYYPFLAGLYSKYSNSGLGFTTIRKPIEEVIRRNGKTISTFASTNNPYVVRAHLQQGFSIDETQYVFVKHNNK